MKNKFNSKKIFFFIFLIFFPNLVLSNELKFNASEIKTFDNGDIIKGSGGVQIEDGSGMTIASEKFEFDKIKSILKAKENVIVKDNLNKNFFKSDDIIFFKKLNTLVAKNKTIIELDSGHIIETSNITYDRNLNKISSNKKTLITDLNNNKSSMSGFNFFTIDKVLMASDVKIIDKEGNTYNLENISYNMKTNEILGKDLNLNFNNTFFGSGENEPRLKGNSFSLKDNITQVNSGVFTTCKKNDSCPPWLLKSDKIQHDKTKKTINYKNALLKIYDIPVLYFPKFFHPDPTVKRQSGFLAPNFSQSNNYGNFISTPYFFAISDTTDLTFSPRIYDNGTAIYQSEYRNYRKNSKHVADFSVRNDNSLSLGKKNVSSQTHFFLESEFNLDTENFDEASIDLKIQQTSEDEYLKAYKIKSPLIESESILHSSIDFNFIRDDLDIEITTEVYENLTRLESDRYEYIYPGFSVSKNIKETNRGNFSLESAGVNKLYNTNIYEKTLINDLTYKSFNKISALGLVSNYEVLFKNFNSDSDKSLTYKNETENSLQSIINYVMKYPLQKIGENFSSSLTPIVSVKYSPNKSKNISKQDREINVDNVFSLNRIGSSDTVEGGQSITIGNEYALYDSENVDKKVFSIDLATSFRDKKNDKLPINSTLGEEHSNIFGSISFNTNKLVDFDYNFSLDNDLETLNMSQIKSTLSFNNFVTTFDFLEKSNLMSGNSFISNESKLQINKNSSLSFKTRENKEKDITEYYNLIYEYQNDCLIAGLEFKKDFYSDGSLKPDEQLFFSITIMPFGKGTSPNINQ